MGDSKPKSASAAAGVWGIVKPFANGGASGMLATCVIQPIDMVKVKNSILRDLVCFDQNFGG